MNPERRTEPSQELKGLTDGLVSSGRVSAVVAGVAEEDRLVWAAGGVLDPENRATTQVSLATYFDLASLTKPFAATAALLLDQAGILTLDTPLGSVIPDLPAVAQRQPLSALLRHSSGLIPWFPFYRDPPGVVMDVTRFADPRLWQRTNEGAMYSDLGPILWSRVAAGYRSISTALIDSELIATYSPDPDRTAATRLSNRREVQLAAALGIKVEEETVTHRGAPQDGNARFLDQCGHAGLFGNLDAVLALGREWMQPRLLAAAAVQEGLRAQGRYALGWWRADPGRDGLPVSAFGHNGFTGCSLWIEPVRGRLMVLLAHRTSLSDTLDDSRREFHRLAMTLTI